MFDVHVFRLASSGWSWRASATFKPIRHCVKAMTLLAWGANSYGQLGVGYECEQLLTPTAVPLAPDHLSPTNIQAISAGAGHTVILTKYGRLYACGWNAKGQLGLDAETLTFTEIQALTNYRITQISCGWDFSAAIAHTGQLFVWGSNAFLQLGLPSAIKSTAAPTLVASLAVKHVSCGLRHMAVVTAAGDVMVTGTGNKGQLGLTDNGGKLVRQMGFKTVPGLDNMVSVSCGQFHTLCLRADGHVFGWGDNKHGQLGLDRAQCPVPHAIHLDLVPQQVFTGWTHSAVLAATGEIVNFGRNTYGQLGSGRSNTRQPARILETQRITQLSLGSEHNLAVNGARKLLCWGWNEHGNCGTGDTENVTVPAVVLPEATVLYAAAGTGQSFAVIAESSFKSKNSSKTS